MKRRRIRFTCTVCGRRRGFTRCSGRFAKRQPICEECCLRLERERWNDQPEDGNGEKRI